MELRSVAPTFRPKSGLTVTALQPVAAPASGTLAVSQKQDRVTTRVAVVVVTLM
jgi:hypothetical protein